jgi:hypothetical protein
MAVEEHGSGRQLARFRVWPRWSRLTVFLLAVVLPLAILAGLTGAYVAATILGALGAAVLVGLLTETSRATCAFLHALDRLARGEDIPSVDLPPIEAHADINGAVSANGGRRQPVDANALEALVAERVEPSTPKVRR